MKKRWLFLVAYVFIFPTHSQNSYTYSTPVELEDGWKVKSIYSLSYDTSIVNKLFNHLKDEDHKIHSVLLIKDEEIIIEEYFKDQTISTPHDLRSVTKSIRSILMGIAIDKGYIGSIDDPISKYLPELKPKKNQDPRKEEITIRHLLTMSSGLDCNDWDAQSKGQEDKVYKKKDWLQYTIDLPMINDPGTVSNYCSMGAILVAEIISKASGKTISDFAEEYLFKPLAIENVRWGHTSSKEVISSGKRLYMTSRDMAKIGQLILNEGRWNEQKVISKNWVIESTTPKIKINGLEYGYFWLNFPFLNGKENIIAKTATGNGGQYIFIFPELNSVMIFTGEAYNSNEDKLPFAIINDVYIPTFF